MSPPRLQLLSRALLRQGEHAEPLGPRLAPLLALVALAGPLDRARAAALLYPHLDSAAASTNLRQLLHAQRALLAQTVVANGPQLQLKAGVQVDALEPVQAGDPNQSEAPLLGEFDFASLPEFQQWLRGERERRIQQRFDWRLELIAQH